MTKIWIICATRFEASACHEGVQKSGKSRGFQIFYSGMGAANSRRFLVEKLSQLDPPDLIVSSGLAGSQSASLKKDQWICAHSLKMIHQPIVYPTVTSHQIIGVELETVPKLGAASTAVAVDMESYPLVEIAEKEKIPSLVVRLLSDSPDAPLPKFIVSMAEAQLSRALAEKLSHFYRGSVHLFQNPKQLAHLLHESQNWKTQLSEGWIKFAAEWA